MAVMSRVKPAMILALGMVLCAALASAQSPLSLSLTFHADSLSFSQVDTFDVVSYADYGYTTVIGEPKLPLGNLHVSIPVESVIDSVLITFASTDTLPGTYNLLAVQPLDTTSAGSKTRQFVEPNASIYGSQTPYPENIIRHANQGYLAGHGLAGFVVHPVRYIPAEQMLIFHETIDFSVYFSPGGDPLTPITKRSENSSRLYTQMAKSLVLNPDDVIPYDLPPGDYEYVVITTADLVEPFQRLADWKTQKGIPATIKTTAEIDAEYETGDLTQKIKDFIADAYHDWGTTWVLMGGDSRPRVVPTGGYWRDLYDGDNVPEDFIPADQYFADVEGELYAEVMIGRASVNNYAQAQVFVDKVLQYERWPPLNDYALKMLFMAFDLTRGWPGYSTRAENTVERIIIPIILEHSDDFVFKKLYEYGGEIGTHAACVAALHDGYNIATHMNHGSQEHLDVADGWNLQIADMDAIRNGSKQSILYSMSCKSADFDHWGGGDCIAEHFVNNPDGGGVAYIGNSSYGWFGPCDAGATPSGGSFEFQIDFFHSLFDFDIFNIGATLSHSKDVNVPGAYNEWPDWTYYTWIINALNLLGDPEMPIWTADPVFMEVLPTTQMPVGVQTQCRAIVTNPAQGGAAVDDALCCISGCGVYETGFTVGGQFLANVTPTTTGHISIAVTKHNFIPHVSYGKASLGVPDLIIRDWDDGAGGDLGVMPSWDVNGNLRFDGAPPDRASWHSPDITLEPGELIPDPGGTHHLYAYVKNHSGRAATDVQVEFYWIPVGVGDPWGFHYIGSFEVDEIAPHAIEHDSYVVWQVPLGIPRTIRVYAKASCAADPVVSDDAAWDNNVAWRGFTNIGLEYVIPGGRGGTRDFYIWNPDSTSTQDLYLTLYEEGWPGDWTYDLTAGSSSFSQIDTVTYVFSGVEPAGVREATLEVFAPQGAENDTGTVHVVGTVADELFGGVAFEVFPPTNGASIDSVMRTPCVPLASEAVAVGAVVTDDSAVDSVQVIYMVDGGSPTTLAMPQQIGDLYMATIPAQADGALVQFRIRGFDDSGNITVSTLHGYYSGTVAIGSVRENDLQGRNIHESYGVRVSGVATVATGVFREQGNGVDIYVQDTTGGIPAGINVFDTADSTLVSLGDSLVVAGRLEQHNGAVQIRPCDPEDFITKVGVGTQPTPVTVTLSEISEGHEGLLIKVLNTCNVDSLTSWPAEGEDADLDIIDCTGDLVMRIDKDTDLDGTPEPTWPQDVTGICIQADVDIPYDDDYLLQPRGQADFSPASGVGEPTVPSRVPALFSLAQNYPNPFGLTTVIKYALPVDCQVKLEIFNLAGRKVVTLVDERQKAGNKIIKWDSRNQRGEGVASGVYFYRLRTDGFVKTRKLVLLR